MTISWFMLIDTYINFWKTGERWTMRGRIDLFVKTQASNLTYQSNYSKIKHYFIFNIIYVSQETLKKVKYLSFVIVILSGMDSNTQKSVVNAIPPAPILSWFCFLILVGFFGLRLNFCLPRLPWEGRDGVLLILPFITSECDFIISPQSPSVENGHVARTSICCQPTHTLVLLINKQGAGDMAQR